MLGLGNRSKQASFIQHSMQEGIELMNKSENYILVDVRRIDEFNNGHIKGAINIPNESIGLDDIKELPDKKQLIFVYCRSGARSKQAATKLVKLGYTNIHEIGGILDYKGELEV